MTNLFLKVDKDWFKLGLNPTELLIFAQIAEFQRNTGDCFISDGAFAEMFNVSESTVSRALKALETKGLIKRETKNVKGGKARHLYLTNSKMTVDSCEQPSNCLLTNVNLTIDNKQNDLIKDKEKDKEKDNLGASLAPVVAEKAPEVIPEAPSNCMRANSRTEFEKMWGISPKGV